MNFNINKKLIFSSLFAGIIMTAPTGALMAKEQSTVKSETLLKSGSSWDGTPYKSYLNAAPEISVLKITIPPHTKLPWHTHPMVNAAYVLSGDLTVEKKTGQKQTLTQGQVLPEMVGIVHRGVTHDKPAVLIVFYAGAKGVPLSEKSN